MQDEPKLLSGSNQKVNGWLRSWFLSVRRRSAIGKEAGAKRIGPRNWRVGKEENVVSQILRLDFGSSQSRQATREGRCEEAGMRMRKK
jgi:hypothetical protein